MSEIDGILLIFRSAEFPTPLSILKEMINKKQILIFQHNIDALKISKYQIEVKHVLNFLYNMMICIHTETIKNVEKHWGNNYDLWNGYENDMEWYATII